MGTNTLFGSLRARGFDRSKPLADGAVRVGCSQCAALVISGVACHETGCPNAGKICKGCDTSIPKNGPGYCEDCQ